MALVYPAALLVSAAAIGYEILLMRLLSIVQWHHFAYMIISLALFGYAASGTAIALARRFLEPRFAAALSLSALLFSVSMVLAFYLAQRVPFNALEILWRPVQFLGLAAIYLVFMVPFFFAACCIGLAFTCRRDRVERIYFFDLVGAGTGGLVIIVALFRLSPPYALVALALLALAASMLAGIAARAGAGIRLPLLQFVVLALLAGFAPQHLLDMRMSEYKSLSQTMQVADTEITAVRSSPLGLLTVVASPAVPFRYAPGLSFAASSTPPEQLAVFTDGDDMSVITRYGGDFDALTYLGEMTSALPYQLLDAPSVAILGAGGGDSVLQGLYFGVPRIDVVELNPQMVGLVRETYGDFAGQIFDDPAVTVHVGEARGFIAGSDTAWDLIQVSLLDSFATSGSGAQGLSESYLYTVEALSAYLEHLTADGMLSITRWLQLPARDSLKLIATAIRSLRRAGVGHPGEHLAVVRSWNTVTLLIGKSPLSAQQTDRLRAWTRSLSFDTAWYPSMPTADANRYNRLDGAPLYAGVRALLGEQAADFIERYKFDISPATDDKPYFFHFFRWGVLPEMLALARQGGGGLIEWGYLVLIATIVQAVVAGFVVILLPLRLCRWQRQAPSSPVPGSYFFLLGLAFLFVEIAFIQKFILFLHHPLYSVAVVLTGFLVFAGVGSAASGTLLTKAGARGVSPVSVAVAAIAALVLLYLWLLPVAFAHWMGQADALKAALSVALIAPLAFFMGMPFPIGLKLAGDATPGFVPWAWGINGFASVVSATLATLLAIEFGFTVVLLIAILLYSLAAILIRHAQGPPASGCENGTIRRGAGPHQSDTKEFD